MKDKPAARKYKVSDAQLKMDAGDLLLCVRRDAKDFATLNITEANCKALDSLLEAFDTTTTDEEDRGERSEATELKDAKAEALRTHIRSIRGMADRAFGAGGPYRRFGFDGMNDMKDNDLYMLAGRVMRVSNQLKPALAAKGPIDDELTALSDLMPQFETAIHTAHDEDVQRHLAAQTRIHKGNAIWDVMTDFCKAGKNLYQDNDEAKYHQYVMSEGSGPGTPPATLQ